MLHCTVLHRAALLAVCIADTLLGILTVEEMLMYTAELKRPLSETLAQKKEVVEELIEVRAGRARRTKGAGGQSGNGGWGGGPSGGMCARGLPGVGAGWGDRSAATQTLQMPNVMIMEIR